MASKYGTKTLSMLIPVDLHDMLRKTAINNGLTSKEVIMQYLEYLKKQDYKQRTLINAKTKTDFKLQGRNSEELSE